MIGSPIRSEIVFIMTSDISGDSYSEITFGTISMAESMQHAPLTIPVILNPDFPAKFVILRMRNNAGAKHATMNRRTVTKMYSIIPIIFYLSPTFGVTCAGLEIVTESIGVAPRKVHALVGLVMLLD